MKTKFVGLDWSVAAPNSNTRPIHSNRDILLSNIDNELRAKFRWLAKSALPTDRIEDLETLIWTCDQLQDATQLADALANPI